MDLSELRNIFFNSPYRFFREFSRHIKMHHVQWHIRSSKSMRLSKIYNVLFGQTEKDVKSLFDPAHQLLKKLKSLITLKLIYQVLL